MCVHFVHIHESWFSQLVFRFGKTVFLGRLLFISSDWCQTCLVSVKQGNTNIYVSSQCIFILDYLS